MSKAPSWNNDGSGEESREAARESARRAEKNPNDRPEEAPLGERRPKSARNSDELDEADEQRLQTIARRLAEAMDRSHGGRSSSRLRHEGDPDRSFEAEAIIGDAISLFKRHATDGDRSTARALESVARLIGEHRRARSVAEEDGGAEAFGRYENELRERYAKPRHSTGAHDPDAAYGEAQLRPLADAIAEMTRRRRPQIFQADSDEEQFRRSEAAPAPRFDDLKISIDSISKQIEEFRSGDAARDDRRRFVMGQINHLRDEVAGVSRALADLAPRSSIAAIEAALRTLVDSVEAQRDRGVQDNVLAPVERLATDLRAMVKELDPGPIVRSLHAEVQTIGRKLSELQSAGGANGAAIGELTRQSSEIRNLLAAVASRPLPLEKLETRLIELAQRVDGFGVASRDAGQKDVAEIIKTIRTTVATETSGTLQAFGQRLEELGAKVDSLASKSGGAKRFDDLGYRLDEVQKSLAARIDRAGAFHRPMDISPLEHLVSKLAKRIDASLEPKTDFDKHFTELAQRIDQTEQTLAARIEQGDALRANADVKINELLSAPIAEKRFEQLAGRIDGVYSAIVERIDNSVRSRSDAENAQLAELVGQLATKINTALDPKADNQVLLTLAQQIDKLSRRLDRTENSAATLVSVEQTIGQLFKRIEEKQNTAEELAEAAARRAAQEALREASRGLDGALERELADLRKTQTESGKRAQETLSAVHATLERVVDRLAVFEDELTDLRQPSLRQSGVAVREALRAASIAASEIETPRLREAADAPRSPLREEFYDDQFEEEADAPARAEDFDQPLSSSPLMAPERRVEAPARDHRGETSVKSDFIAAARRAAQQAAAEAETAQAINPRKITPKAGARPTPAGGLANVGAKIQERKRPLLLALGALVMLMGAYQVVRVGMDVAGLRTTTARIAEEAQQKPAMDGRINTSNGKSVEAPAKLTPPAAASGAGLAPSAGGSAPPAPKFVSPLDFAPGGLAPPASEPSNLPAPSRPPAAPAASIGVDATPTGAIERPDETASNGSFAAMKDLASRGDGAAQFELGSRYSEGRGVARDFKAAAQWFEKAAGQGLAPAEYRIGSIYEKGVGVDRDYATARDWYRRAAEHGNVRAMHNLAVLFAEGGDGKPDYISAASWFRRAAEYGVRDSQYNLGILCARGLGTGQNLVQSYMWFAAAAAQGDEDAAKKRDDVAGRLDSSQLSAARALVEGFRPSPLDKASNEPPPPPVVSDSAKPAKASGKSMARPKVSSM